MPKLCAVKFKYCTCKHIILLCLFMHMNRRAKADDVVKMMIPVQSIYVAPLKGNYSEMLPTQPWQKG